MYPRRPALEVAGVLFGQQLIKRVRVPDEHVTAVHCCEHQRAHAPECVGPHGRVVWVEAWISSGVQGLALVLGYPRGFITANTKSLVFDRDDVELTIIPVVHLQYFQKSISNTF